MAQSLLAIEGGPKAVTAPVGDGWENIGPLEKSYVNEVLDDPKTARRHLELFESDFSKLVKTQHAICTCNGTAALHSAIFAAGATVGKEVIVPSVTWHATISPILHCGATPVFCEVDPNTFCADPEDVKQRITDRTCAIVVTHVYGNPADMDGLLDLIAGTDIKLIEDASHAHGALWDGKPVGSIGHIGCFSLQGSKPVTGLEAGVVVTDDDDLYDQMMALGQYGRCGGSWKTDRFTGLHNMGLGVKYRANPFGIAMARGRLERLSELNEKRRKWFAQMDELLDNVEGVETQKAYPKATRGGLLLYAGLVDPEAYGVPVSKVLEALVAEGVRTKPEITPYGYGVMHLESLFNDFSFEGLGGPWGYLPDNARKSYRPGSLPISERIHSTCFWLSTPVDPDPIWVEQTAEAFQKVYDNRSRLSELTDDTVCQKTLA